MCHCDLAQVDVATLPALSFTRLKEICKEHKVAGHSQFSKAEQKEALLVLMRQHFGQSGASVPGTSASGGATGSRVLCEKYVLGKCSGGCGKHHPEVKLVRLPEAVRNAIVAAGKYAFEHHYSKPYKPMPDTFDGDEWDYYMDWDPLELSSGTKIQRPNHNLTSAMRKALLVLPVCEALWPSKWAPNETELIAMCVAAIFEVVGRESEIGFTDDRKLYLRYKSRSIEAYETYGCTAPWASAVPDAAKALENMYYEPHQNMSPRSARMQDVLELVHELDLPRC